MKKELGCWLYGILICIAIGIVYMAVDGCAGNPNEHTVKGQLVPLFSLGIVILILAAAGVFKRK